MLILDYFNFVSMVLSLNLIPIDSELIKLYFIH